MFSHLKATIYSRQRCHPFCDIFWAFVLLLRRRHCFFRLLFNQNKNKKFFKNCFRHNVRCSPSQFSPPERGDDQITHNNNFNDLNERNRFKKCMCFSVLWLLLLWLLFLLICVLFAYFVQFTKFHRGIFFHCRYALSKQMQMSDLNGDCMKKE